MIVVRQKPAHEIIRRPRAYRRVLLVGCNTCAAVALAGGELEVETLVQTLRLAASRNEGTKSEFDGTVLQRQCEPEFVEKLDRRGVRRGAVLGCGAGVALLAERRDVPVYPALDTHVHRRCQGAGELAGRVLGVRLVRLGETAGICPVTRCAKGIMNGPCGGVKDGRCELGDRECAWVLIHDRLEKLDRAAEFDEIHEPKDNSMQTTNCCQWDANAQGGDR